MSLVSPGVKVGPYEIVSRLGAGGMGEVWRARDTRLERSVAIKILPAELASNAQLRLRFEREAKTISQLEHPNICRLYDVGETPTPSNGPLSYLVMELIDGESLADRLSRGPLPLADVLRFGAEIAEALAVAHRAGVVHRDLKPGNIMITKSGAKLLDFGLAKTLQSGVMVSADSATVYVDSKKDPLTERGTIIGTFQYMSPEQLEGSDADARSDIFALGCVLYEMLTGRRAFEGKTRTSLIAAIVAADPRPVKELQPLTPPQLEHVILTCLQKEPDQRWQSAHDVAQELRWIMHMPQSDAPAGKRNSRLALIAVAALLAGLALGAAAMRLLRKAPAERLVHATIVPPPGAEFERADGSGQTVVLSPDGEKLLFTARSSDGKLRVFVRNVGDANATLVKGVENPRYPFWSPDGKSIAYFSTGKLKRVDLSGGSPVTICDVGSNPIGGDWNDAGIILFSPNSGAPLHQVSASGGKPSQITTLDEKNRETTHRWARFLPDGRSFLYLAGSHEAPETSEVNAIYASRLGSKDRKLIARTVYNFELVEGTLLYVRGDALVAQRFDSSKLELRGEPVELAKVDLTPESFFATFSVSNANDLVYVSPRKPQQRELVWIDADGRESGRIAGPGAISGWSVSPDGKRVAVTIHDPNVGPDIWLKDIQRGALTRFTLEGSAGEPVWSADGKRIAYSGDDRDIWTREVERDTKPELLLEMDVWGGPVHWSPDGRYLAFWRFDLHGPNLYDAWLLPLEGDRKPVPLAATAAEEWPLEFSPDGRWMMYSSNASGRSEVYVAALPDFERRLQVSISGAFGGTWKSAKEIWYKQLDSTFVAVTLEEKNGQLEFSAPRPLFGGTRVSGGVDPVGDRIIASRTVGEVEAPQIVFVSNWRALASH